MTTEVTPPPTSASPTARQVWTRSRGVALALVLLVVAAVAIAVVRSDARHGRLDPRSADPSGSRAVAELLADRGVDTRVVTTLDEAADAAGPDTTLLVAVPDLLTPRQQTRLRTATKNSGGRTVLVASGIASVERLAPGVMADPANSLDSTLEPGCDLPAAVRAGSADTGGIRYSSAHPEADECYRSQRLPTLLRIPAPSGDGDTVLLGAPDILLNHRLDEHGNASWRSSSSAPAPISSGTSPPPPTPPPGPRTRRASSTSSPPAGSGAPSSCSSPPPWPPCGGHAARPPRPRETPRGDPRLRDRRRPRPPLPQGRRPRPRRSRPPLRDPHPPRPLVGVPGTQAHSPEALLPALSARLDGDGPSLRTLLFGPPPATTRL